MKYMMSFIPSLSTITLQQVVIASFGVLATGIAVYGVVQLIRHCRQPIQATAEKTGIVFKLQCFFQYCVKQLSNAYHFTEEKFSSLIEKISSVFNKNVVDVDDDYTEKFPNKIISQGSRPMVKEVEIMSDDKESELIDNLDNDYRKSQLICRRLVDLKKITINFTEDEKKRLSEVEKDIVNLEKHLMKTYQKDFSSLGWHGRQSFQRIFFQDEPVIAALKDPLFVKVLLNNKWNGSEKDFGSGVTLSGLFLGGLSSNRLSYLTTVSPNWIARPKVNDEALDFGCMSPGDQIETTPYRVSQQYLLDIEKDFAVVQGVLEEIAKDNSINIDIVREPVMREISEASIEQLIGVFHELINDDKRIDIITNGVAGGSTKPTAMFYQCLSVMNPFKTLLKGCEYDYSRVLGFGLVSHALDARHIAAALYYLNKNEKVNEQYADGLKAINKLLEDARSGNLPKRAEKLIRIRLQQVIIIIINKRKIIGIDDKDDEACKNIINAFSKVK